MSKISLKERLLANRFPDIAKQWHRSKNLPLTPNDVTYGSGKKVWWTCDNKHEFEASVSNRTLGKGCPYCSGNKLLEENSLSHKFPKIAAEFHSTKNGLLTPKDFASKSHKKVYWQCPVFPEHTWKASISSRTGMGAGCPLCTKQTSLPELRIFTELLHLYPDTLNRYKIKRTEADIFIPKHKLAIEFDGSYYHKNKREAEARKEALFQSLNLTLMRVRVSPLNKIKEHDIIVPEGELSKNTLNEIVFAVSRITQTPELYYQYINNSSFFNSDLYNKYINYLPNPFPEDSLINQYPDIAKQWSYTKNHPLTPNNFTGGSGKKVWWQCEKVDKHQWESSISSRVRGRGCPFCANKKVDNTNSLIYNFPELSLELHPEKNNFPLSNLTSSTNRIVWWRCLKGHAFRSSVKGRVEKGFGCPYCNGRKATLESSIKALYPEIAKEWDYQKNHPDTPENFLPKSQKSMHWVCSVNPEHKWKAIIATRTGGNGCPFCAGRLATKDENLESQYPDLADEWDFIANEKPPHLYKAGSGKKVSWVCKENPTHKWKAVIYSRAKMGTGCPICAKNKKRALIK